MKSIYHVEMVLEVEDRGSRLANEIFDEALDKAAQTLREKGVVVQYYIPDLIAKVSGTGRGKRE